MIDERTNKNIEKISKQNEYEFYADFVKYDPIFSEIKSGTFPYKMKLVCAKNYDYSQRMVVILSSHGEYYLLDAYETYSNCDKIALMCNKYQKLNDAIDDMYLLSEGFGGYDVFLVLKDAVNESFEIKFEGTVFMHGEDIMNGIFGPFFAIAAETQKDPEHSYILKLDVRLYTNTNAEAFEDIEELKDRILPLDEKIELNRKIPNQNVMRIKKILGIER